MRRKGRGEEEEVKRKKNKKHKKEKNGSMISTDQVILIFKTQEKKVVNKTHRMGENISQSCTCYVVKNFWTSIIKWQINQMKNGEKLNVSRDHVNGCQTLEQMLKILNC